MKEKEKKQFLPDDLIQELVKNGVPQEDVKVVVGFLGDSDSAGYKRLYLKLELNEYLEIPTTNILYTLSLQTSENPLGGTMIWIKKEPNIKHVRLSSLQAQNDFLKGDIMDRFLKKTVSTELFARGIKNKELQSITMYTDACT
ncbi:hypothetical protein [Bacillus cereus]|uniref:hypothetical protein n=1 Tax=Bacillus cereus TaxID=1396 RepID=UPI000BF67292|nr:hypothetical protein [Bacillus cereus]PFO90859.1 hypothetical protein COJ97_27795 [Bacillus cereus]